MQLELRLKASAQTCLALKRWRIRLTTLAVRCECGGPLERLAAVGSLQRYPQERCQLGFIEDDVSVPGSPPGLPLSLPDDLLLSLHVVLQYVDIPDVPPAGINLLEGRRDSLRHGRASGRR